MSTVSADALLRLARVVHAACTSRTSWEAKYDEIWAKGREIVLGPGAPATGTYAPALSPVPRPSSSSSSLIAVAPAGTSAAQKAADNARRAAEAAAREAQRAVHAQIAAEQARVRREAEAQQAHSRQQ